MFCQPYTRAKSRLKAARFALGGCEHHWLHQAATLVCPPPRADSPLSVLMQNRCLKPWWEWEQVITSGLEHPMSTFLVPTMMLQP